MKVNVLNVSRETFPKSTATAEGMQVINPPCDNYEIAYHYDVKYHERDGRSMYLQILQPMNVKEKTALIIYIPGSAFHRQNVRERVPQLAMLAAKGFCVALLEYTGSEDGIFPALVQDAKEGIRYMRMHSEEYHIDSDAIFTMGDSSGGYTAMMAGLTNGERLFETCEDASVYKVKGIIDFYGPTDITTMNKEPSSQNHSEPDSPEGRLIGQKEVLDNLDLAKPTIIKNYIYKEKTYPPLLMFHGSNDELVPFGQSCELYNALRAAGKQATLYQIEGAHHGDRQFWSNTVLDMVAEFVNTCRKPTRDIYKVLRIEEPDFGCEGVPDGYEPLMEVKLQARDGRIFSQKEKDSALYERQIEEDNFVCQTEQGLMKYRKTIVCYGDSNTYGFNPKNGTRYPRNVRWTGRLAELLGDAYHVVEEGCNGRTTVFDDPMEGWKNGLCYIKPCLNSHKPVDIVILMLGSNDLKRTFHASTEDISNGVKRLVEEINDFADSKQNFRPKIILVSPPVIGPEITSSSFAYAFDETAIQRSKEFANQYMQVAQSCNCAFVDAAEYVTSSEIDGLHLSEAAHGALAVALKQAVEELI